jgi:bifunctional DNase/RNase
MSVYGINLDLFSSSPIVILKVEEENRYLPIWIGQPEARSILMKLQNQEFSRPLTHDLAANLVSEMGGSLERITVTELRDSTFFATLQVEIDGRTVEVDSRPSDAIAIAVRTGAAHIRRRHGDRGGRGRLRGGDGRGPRRGVVDKFKGLDEPGLPGRLQVKK